MSTTNVTKIVKAATTKKIAAISGRSYVPVTLSAMPFSSSVPIPESP